MAGKHANPWETVLIVFGVMGIAMGAFHWSASPWFIDSKAALATWLIDHGALWPLEATLPWWILTDYPEKNDVLTLLDGGLLVAYVVATACALAAAISFCLALATVSFGGWHSARFHHLAQTLIPVAAAGVRPATARTT